MRSTAHAEVCTSRPCCWSSCCVGRAAGASVGHRSARRAQGRACTMPARPSSTWSASRRLPKPEGFFNPKRTGRLLRLSASRERDAGGCRRRPARRTAPRRRRPPVPDMANRLRLLRTRTSRSAATMLFVGNYHGFNTYDIERPNEAEAPRLGRVPRRPGRRVDPRQSAVHVGGADARPRRLRHTGRVRRRSAPSASAASGSSTSAT